MNTLKTQYKTLHTYATGLNEVLKKNYDNLPSEVRAYLDGDMKPIADLMEENINKLKQLQK